MKSLNILFVEWKHFIRSPFKVIALILYIIASVYGLHNGKNLYEKQSAELAKINEKAKEQILQNKAFYKEENPSPDDRPWVDLSIPDWAIWYTIVYHLKAPSSALVYSIGQTEQYGFYKKVTYMSSPYDSDMTKEIANVERLGNNTLDFSFALIFLMPLILIILLYNLQSMEKEQGFIKLIEVQAGGKSKWLLLRCSFYVILCLAVTIGLILYGSILTNVITKNLSAFIDVILYSFLYLLLWSILYFILLRSGNTIIENALKMAGIWLLATFIIPASVNQWISIEKPANLMTDFIDASRDKKYEIYNQSDSIKMAGLFDLYPEITNSPIINNPEKVNYAIRETTIALVNKLSKEFIKHIETDNNLKNNMIEKSFFFNPISFFQNRFNSICETHYYNYQTYRNEIQTLIDKQIHTLVIDTWNDIKIDKERFDKYHEKFSI